MAAKKKNALLAQGISMARRCGLALVVALLASLVDQSMQLRTGVAPTYIPTMRQMTSYEKSMINTMNELVRYIRTRETEQVALFNTREAEQSGRDVEKSIRDNKKAEAARSRYADPLNRSKRVRGCV